MSTKVYVLKNGYSIMGDVTMSANCTCCLIKGDQNIIVDTMTPWDSKVILAALHEHGLTPDDINYVVSTHGHSDHTGNNNLFLNAKHIVGFSISFKDTYFLHPFDKGEQFVINNDVTVVPTPGHTLTDVSVVVKTAEGITVIAGDLFERSEDISDPFIWIEAGSEASGLQRKHRYMVAEMANWIVPGHGPKFEVTEDIRKILKKQADNVRKESYGLPH